MRRAINGTCRVTVLVATMEVDEEYSQDHQVATGGRTKNPIGILEAQ